MDIRGRRKIGYLTGDSMAPDPTNLTYVTWDAENSMVMTWLVNSMNEDISSNYLCYSMAKNFGTTLMKCTLTWEISLKFIN